MRVEPENTVGALDDGDGHEEDRQDTVDNGPLTEPRMAE